MPVHRKAGRVLASILIVYAVLVATHEGEFWPFSIYPMFSQAGQPWTRALVREVPPEVLEDDLWQDAAFPSLPGEPFPVARHGIFQNDLANYVSKTTTWTPVKARGLESMFRAAGIDDRYLMIYKIRGSLNDETPAVDVVAQPTALLTPDSLHFSPALKATHSSE